MIFVVLGTQKFHCNRLLREIDRLVEKQTIKEEVFAQKGYSDYEKGKYLEVLICNIGSFCIGFCHPYYRGCVQIRQYAYFVSLLCFSAR